MSTTVLSNKISLASLTSTPTFARQEPKAPEVDGPIAFFRNKSLPKAEEKKPASEVAKQPDSSGTDQKQAAIDAAEKAAASAQTEEDLRNAIAALEAAHRIESAPRTSPTATDPILQRYRPDLGLPSISAGEQSSLGKLRLSDLTADGGNLVNLQSRQPTYLQGLRTPPQSLLSLFV